jgi:branched-chain amino acid transport system substrate-binding protein
MAKLALLIGVSEYQPGLNTLPATTKDIEALKKVLQNPEIGNFTEVKTLINPDRQEMGEAIEGIFSDRSKDDLVLLYFSGHGIKDESGKLYFANSITRKNTSGVLFKATAVAASYIHDIMNSSRSKRQVVILDCCFSGAFADGVLVKDDGFVDIKNQLGGEGRAILTSSTSTQYSFEESNGDLSTYTRYLVQGLETGAADRESDSWISVDELHEYVRRKVQEASPAMNPQIYASKEGYKIQLAKAPVDDPKFKYRQEVEYWATEGQISEIGQAALDELRKSLGLTEIETNLIEEDVIKPHKDYRRKLERYTEVFKTAVQQTFPLSERVRVDLARLQQSLGLNEGDIALIEAPILEEYQQNVDGSNKINSRNLLQSSRAVLGAILFFLAGFGVAQYNVKPEETTFCSTDNSDPNPGILGTQSPEISIGEKILLDTNGEKVAASDNFAAKNFDQAISKFQSYQEKNFSDPETLIYLNNAKIGSQSSFKIAVSVPIGTDPEVSKEILRGVSQAQNEVNNNPDKINGRFLKVAIANDNNKKEDAKEIANRLVKDTDILAVVGHNKSEASLSAADIYEQENLVMISPTSDATILAVRKPPIFHIMPEIKFVAQKLSDYALGQNLKQVLICVDSNSKATLSFQNDFTEFFREKGEISEVKCDFSNPKFNSESILQSAKNVSAILLLPGVGSTEKAIDLARANRWQKALLANPTFNSIQNIKKGGCALKNAVVVVPWDSTQEPGKTFLQKSTKLWGIAMTWRSAMAYDSTQAIVEGLRKTQKGSNANLREQLANQLKDENFSFDGVTGKVRFKGNRETPMMLLKVQPPSADTYEFVPFSFNSN